MDFFETLKLVDLQQVHNVSVLPANHRTQTSQPDHYISLLPIDEVITDSLAMPILLSNGAKSFNHKIMRNKRPVLLVIMQKSN